MKIAKILVQGIVQGVGFRPSVYRIVNALGLKGYIRNLGNIVEIILFEDEKQVNDFIAILKEKKPAISKINSITVQWIDESRYFYPKNDTFEIVESSTDFSGASVIPPDLAICDNCLEEINDSKNRRYKYPFTTCIDCGIRFTVIENVPYDRDKTSMDDFPLCQKCEKEYTNPLDRRYHAESTCCETCGPSLKLYNHKENEINTINPLEKAVKLLDEGKILAMKGIGGTHLITKVRDNKPIKKLRKRLNRPNQPFAVMSRNLETAKTFTEVSSKEAKSLLSKERPIVILKKSKNYDFAESLAPELHNIGVMLCYSPLHHIMFDYTDEPAYIMTSANISGEPMMIKNKEILSSLYGIGDYYLLHNRRIINRCDDSVIRYRANELSFIRRSRGYTPEPYDLNDLIKTKKINKDLNILALGPEIDVTFTLQKQGLAYVSQHIGNTNKFKTYEFLQEAIKNMRNITKTENFDAIACDMHPQFFTSHLANEMGEKFNCEVIPIQHHHAHGAVLAMDNSLDELVFIAADGVGYGEDGSTWGGEIMYTNINNYERLASLSPQKMPGGDISTKYPVRMLESILSNSETYQGEELESLLSSNYSHYFQHRETEIKSVLKQINSNLNVGITTSTGRILDSIAVALNICGERTYEGECSMKLESFAYGANGDLKIEPQFKKINGRPILDTTQILVDIMKLISNKENKKEIAAAGQKVVSEGLAILAVDTASKMGINNIGATGGVFYNEAITLATKKYVESEGFNFVQHKNSCAGDGSVSLGQSLIASSKIN
ncbi:Acylphosphatase [Candidatus Methanobinarius endosymbioticus]|uniref:Carbamoyltransferase n=1 Tax=Candidatus Methanobinarius endosymbioticus TaxID=2006182 RepID=A0A366M9H1_9EURY|nr:Acylphosphatase [Candidatus Methanobinarius endosymbioticus]